MKLLTTNNYTKEEVLKLRDKYYRRIKKAGFEDIELIIPGVYIEVPLFRQQELRCLSGRADYFDLATQFLYKGKFKSVQEKKFWKYHCEGLKAPEIAKKFKKISAKKITATITAIKKEMLATIVREEEICYPEDAFLKDLLEDIAIEVSKTPNFEKWNDLSLIDGEVFENPNVRLLSTERRKNDLWDDDEANKPEEVKVLFEGKGG